ncbi:acyl-CoA dehydrogenase family protein [Streptomyces griseus]|nr:MULTISPECIES: acyl-CoA dehydrogenase family protein [Streptomyces]MYT78993.1 acyl-CoA dehydrogenase [Streptomyces sp. SID8364]SBU94177.1 Acyl-CoA dehydrogenase [Streptomyces sp. MnatMP-M77]SED73170.1 Acyl-CoA dehydrogenase [Streptomyces griseus]SQA24565.1 acyl-CoA dehydrogenase [Streptomyces griseus]
MGALNVTARPDLAAPVTEAGSTLLALVGEQTPALRADADERDRTGTFPDKVFEHFGTSGVLGGTVPAELGGLGVGSLHDIALVLEEVARADASAALALHVQFSRGLTLTYEWRHGKPEAAALAERMLRAMATGTARVCGAVKDHPSAVTRLEPDGTGGWLLTGQKTLVSMAPVATHFFAYALVESEGRTCLAAPLIARGTPGLTVLDTWDGLGMRSSGTWDIRFDRCRVPDADVLVRGPVGERGDAALAGQTVSSITMLGIYLGIARAARDAAVEWQRGRSGAPAAVRVLVADVEARLYAARATTAAALAEADALTAEAPDPAVRGPRMMTPFQCAKLTLNRLALDIVNDCLTIVGGASYAGASSLSRLYRDVRAGWFMQPYTYPDAVDYLSARALRIDHDDDYMSTRAARFAGRG